MNIHESVFVAEGSVIKGDVTIGKDSGVWFNAVVRGDTDRIVIGERTNVQDGSVLHVDTGFPLTIGDDVTIGHNAIVHGCTIGNNVKIYQGVTLGALSFPLDENGNPIKGVKRHPNIEDNVVIYAGATILGGKTTIGHDTVLGSNIWLTYSVPPYSRVYNSQPSPNISNSKEVVIEYEI